MIPLTLAELADVVGGSLLDPDDRDVLIARVTIDSRGAGAGALFVPLPGEHVDGHDFIMDAYQRGAHGYLLAAGRTAPEARGAVVVDDPADALTGLGAWMRDTVDPMVVAVTGSTGKTTTKDLIAAALGLDRRVVANPGSYNNELGVPLTCCLLERDSEVLVAEVGARGLGHIAVLASFLRPDVSVVTTVSAAHLELLGDLDTVQQAKTELVEALRPEGTAVLNADQPRVAAMRARAAGRVVTYGTAADADWRAVDVRVDEWARARFDAVHAAGRVAVSLPMPGLHNVGNALAALAVASACGVDAERAAEGLRTAAVSRWRMELATAPAGYLVLNDAYNANPASTAAALDTLGALPSGRRWAALGLMAELGDGSEDAHITVGAHCAELGLDGLVVVGPQAAAIARGARETGFAGALHEVPDVEAAGQVLEDSLADGDAVLVKASRAVGLERLAARLLGPPQPGGQQDSA